MDDLKPYRLEWRASYSSRWMRIEDLDEHPGDLQEYVKGRDRAWVGHWRVISQHVIEEART